MGRIPVVGIAGGIGSGKSEVARLFEGMGAVVIDSDVQARAALELPEVKGELVRWWGERVLNQDGSVNRTAVADIVFHDEGERKRLEGLVHPLVRSRRAAVIAEAQRRGASLAVIDAPLLFEAGVDAECDAVVFVDTPRELRLARVKASRGWDEAELNRRESSQMRLDEKRARSRFVVSNAGDRGELERRVREVFEALVPG